MRIKKKTINELMFFLFLIYPSFRCIGFEMAIMGTATPIYIRIWSLVALIISIFVYFFEKKYEKKDLPIILYCGYMLLISLYFKLKGNEVALTSLCAYITAFMGTLYCVKKYKNKVIDYFIVLLGGLSFIQFILPKTIFSSYFLQSATLTFIGHIQIYSLLWTLLTTFILLKLLFVRKKKGFLSIGYIQVILYALLIINAILAAAAGVVVAFLSIATFIAAFWLFKYKKINQTKWLTIIFITLVVINILTVFFDFQKIFENLLYYLNEDVTLNGRQYIWSLFIPKISESPYIGYGYKALGVVLSNWGHTNNMDYCHNTVLQEIIHGGIIQLCLFIYLNLAAIKGMKQNVSESVQHLLLCGLTSMYLIMISESVTYYNYWNVMITLAVAVNYLDVEHL